MFRAVLIVAFSIPAFASEYAVLSSGMRIHVDRYERTGEVVRLFIRDGVTELPASLVTAFEQEDYIPPAPAAAPEPGPAVVPAPVQVDESIAAKVVAAEINNPKALLRDAAERSGLPPAFGKLVQSVAKVESGFDSKAVSPKGAIGVMQLMPETARHLGADPHDLAQNIDAGARLLRDLLLKYDGDVIKALAAYNAGEAAVDRFQGVPPYSETRHYVNRVVWDYLRSGGQ